MSGSGSRRQGDPADDWRIGPASLALSGLIRAVAATVEFRFHDDATIRSWEQECRPFILAFWHRYLILMRYAYRGTRMSVLVSQSWDGELTSQTLAHLGIDTCRGSSTRGGAAALRDLLRRARSGSDLTFTPDGPKGPPCKVQPGVIVAAAMTGLPIQPVALGATRRKLLRSWDKMLLPLPGARVDIVFGEPLAVAPRSPVAEGVERLERALFALDARAEGLSGQAGGASTAQDAGGER
ncbi:MAG: lysophospholipid acyltransferase family protein [Thermoanaerobaculia bacterium]